MKDDFFPHLSLMYGFDEDSTSKDGIGRAERLMGEMKRDGNVRKREGGIELGGVREFEVGEVLLVRCEGEPEDWRVLGSVSLG